MKPSKRPRFKMQRCVVCDGPTLGDFCIPCDEAHDRFARSARATTSLALIKWAAGRARRLERAVHESRKGRR